GPAGAGSPCRTLGWFGAPVCRSFALHSGAIPPPPVRLTPSVTNGSRDATGVVPWLRESGGSHTGGDSRLGVPPRLRPAHAHAAGLGPAGLRRPPGHHHVRPGYRPLLPGPPVRAALPVH